MSLRMVKERKAAVVGATGMAGQQFIVALNKHPLIETAILAASERSAGKKYKDAIRSESAYGWYCNELPPEWALDMVVQEAKEIDVSKVDLIFSAVEEGSEARKIEEYFAPYKPVISTSSAFRYERDTPILIPGVNNDHAKLIRVQQSKRGWKGFTVPIPNCTTTGLAISLKPYIGLDAHMKKVHMSSIQSVSGAGRRPGVKALDIIDNVQPYIKDEEEKVDEETKKILGTYLKHLGGGSIGALNISINALCKRIAVLDGHTESVFVDFDKEIDKVDILGSIDEFNEKAADELKGLPSAPKKMITVFDDPFMPQTRIVRDLDGGMTTSIGRLTCRADELKYVLVSHNTKMGAAKGAVLVAELLMKQGYIE